MVPFYNYYSPGFSYIINIGLAYSINLIFICAITFRLKLKVGKVVNKKSS